MCTYMVPAIGATLYEKIEFLSVKLPPKQNMAPPLLTAKFIENVLFSE